LRSHTPVYLFVTLGNNSGNPCVAPLLRATAVRPEARTSWPSVLVPDMAVAVRYNDAEDARMYVITDSGLLAGKT